MESDDRPAVPFRIEHVLDGLEDLAGALGVGARPALSAVRTLLLDAMAARDRGDVEASFEAIRRAMDRLADLAGVLDPREAMLMRAVSEQFRRALLRRDVPEAMKGLDVMLERSGSVRRGSK